jgi:hypothetical protein
VRGGQVESLGIIGPIAGVIFALAAPDSTGRTVAALDG